MAKFVALAIRNGKVIDKTGEIEAESAVEVLRLLTLGAELTSTLDFIERNQIVFTVLPADEVNR